MLEVPVYNTQGQQVETLQVDEQRFGGQVNVALLKQAVVMYHTNRHQGSAATRNRGRVEGSTRKLYAQKHTGNARRGPIRTNIMKGGGVAFAKIPHRSRLSMSKKMRRAALDSAILAKMLGRDLVVVDGLKLEKPRTREVAGVLQRLSIQRTCLLTMGGVDDVLYRSARNIEGVAVRTVAELNAFDVALRQKMLLTREAMDTLLQGR